MKTATRFVFEFDEAQASGKVLSATDADLLRRMVEARDAEHADEAAIAWTGLMAWQQWAGLLEPGSPNGDEPRRERISARLATLSRQGEGDVVERVLAVECREHKWYVPVGQPCHAGSVTSGGPTFCASRLRAAAQRLREEMECDRPDCLSCRVLARINGGGPGGGE